MKFYRRDEYVDMSCGTGAVTTLCHDPRTTLNCKRYDLPIESIISPEGSMINVPAQFLGLTPVFRSSFEALRH